MATGKSKGKKIVVLMCARLFPAYHSKKGEPTNFQMKIKGKDKLHTIRAGYEKWKKKIDEVLDGKAVLSVREWSGSPYNSKQNYLFYYNQDDPLGVSKLTKDKDGYLVNDTIRVTEEELAKNDGLLVQDFREWFKVMPTEPMAIIHLTGFRYENFQDFEPIRCLTFDKKAQDNLPEHIKEKMKRDRENARKNG